MLSLGKGEHDVMFLKQRTMELDDLNQVDGTTSYDEVFFDGVSNFPFRLWKVR